MMVTFSSFLLCIIWNSSIMKICPIPFIYLFSHLLSHCGHMDIYLIPWIIIDLFLICSSNCSTFGLGSTFGLAPGSVWLFFLSLPYSLAPWHAPGLFCMWPHQPRISLFFFKDPWFLRLENGIGSGMWALGRLVAAGLSLLLGFSGDVCSNPHNTHKSVFLYPSICTYFKIPMSSYSCIWL